MQNRRFIGVAIVLVLVVTALGLTSNQASAELNLDWFTADGGGWTFSGGGHYSLGGSVGQPDAGSSSGGNLELFGGFWLGGESVASGIETLPIDPAEEIAFRLMAGFPNPFADGTGIQLDLPDPRQVEVAIFDHAGRLVRVLCEREMSSGHHRFTWDGRSHNGHQVASGIYLVKVRAGTEEARQRVVLLR